jgi:hypothetical protein
VGSRGNLHWNTRQVREIRRKLSLSEIQRGVLIGTILGDGCLSVNAAGKHYRLKVEQGKDRKEYVFWLYNIFRNWTLSPPKYQKSRRAWRFYTLSHPEITNFRKIFYRDKRKIIPVNIQKYLIHPISLAVWFMDDGGLESKKKTSTISTHSFSEEENELLIECFRKNFGLKINLNWDGKGFRLYIPMESIKTFKNLVYPYILPSMMYKLPSTP